MDDDSWHEAGIKNPYQEVDRDFAFSSVHPDFGQLQGLWPSDVVEFEIHPHPIRPDPDLRVVRIEHHSNGPAVLTNARDSLAGVLHSSTMGHNRLVLC